MNKFRDNNGHHLEILHTALTNCTLAAAPPNLAGSPKNRDDEFVVSIHVCKSFEDCAAMEHYA